MASATIEKLVGLFDRREHRTLPPMTPQEDGVERAAWRQQIINALERLEANGVFGRQDALGQTLTESLVVLAEGALWDPFAREPGRTRIYGELIFNLVDPKRINQGLKGTCAAACIESYMAEREPAEYARIVAGLVTSEGRVTLRRGDVLVCDEDVLGPGPLERTRNPVSRIFQAACMEFAYPNMNYDNVIDGHFDGDENVGSGLEMGAFERLLAAVTGETWKTTSVAHANMSKLFSRLGIDTNDMPDIGRDGLSIIDQSTRQGEHVFVTLELPSLPNPISEGQAPVLHNMPHKVRAVGIDWNDRSVHYDDPMDPAHRWFDGAQVTIHDAYGHCSMPIDDFLRLMTELSYRPSLWKRNLGSLPYGA